MALPFLWTLIFVYFLKERSNLSVLKMSILRQRKSLIKPPSPSLITVLDDTLPPCPSPSSGSFGYANIALIVPASGRVTWLPISHQQCGRFTKGTKFYGNSNMETKREYFVHYFLYFYLEFRAKHCLACVQTSPIPFVARSTGGPLMYL